MSDTGNKAETKTENTSTMKQNSKPEVTEKPAPRSNIVIPLVLLLVSAIVIIATFYDEEYKELIAQDASSLEVVADSEPSSQHVDTADPEEATTEISAETTADASEITIAATKSDADNAELATKEESATNVSVIAETPVTTEKQSSAKTESVINQAKDTALDSQKTVALARTADNREMQSSYKAPNRSNTYTSRQSYEQTRQNAIRRVQEQAKKRDEAMQQHRLAYEKEMQERRQYYEAARKTQQERRSRIAQAQKAVYQRVQQNRTETRQKLQEMHNQISEMHNEIHQILRDSHVNHMPGTQVQTQSPSAEQI